jgi:hypothetical protein
MAYNPINVITTAAEYANTLGTGSIYAQVTGYGNLRVTDEPSPILSEAFDALDTTTTWNTVTQVSGATVVQSAGIITLTGGTTALAIGSLDSRPTFIGGSPGFLQVSWGIKLESVATVTTAFTATASRFWGVGSPGGGTFTTPTTATPIADGVGWEIDFSTGNLLAVVYANGVRTTVANLTTGGLIKNDGLYHRYTCYSRTDLVFWYIDSLDAPVAISNYNFSQIQTLAARIHIVNKTPSPTSTVLICTDVSVADTAIRYAAISDGTYAWRKAKVNSVGALSATGTGTAGTADAGVLTVQGIASATAIAVAGDVAAASTDSGNPTKIGGVGRTANPTAVTDGQRANVMLDKMGRQVVVQGHVRDLVVRQATTLTLTSAVTILAAQGASVFADITLLMLTNTSATATRATVSDGTLSFDVAIAANGGAVVPFNPPLTATTANTTWTVALTPTVTDIRCFVQAVKNL